MILLKYRGVSRPIQILNRTNDFDQWQSIASGLYVFEAQSESTHNFRAEFASLCDCTAQTLWPQRPAYGPEWTKIPASSTTWSSIIAWDLNRSCGSQPIALLNHGIQPMVPHCQGTQPTVSLFLRRLQKTASGPTWLQSQLAGMQNWWVHPQPC